MSFGAAVHGETSLLLLLLVLVLLLLVDSFAPCRACFNANEPWLAMHDAGGPTWAGLQHHGVLNIAARVFATASGEAFQRASIGILGLYRHIGDGFQDK